MKWPTRDMVRVDNLCDVGTEGSGGGGSDLPLLSLLLTRRGQVMSVSSTPGSAPAPASAVTEVPTESLDLLAQQGVRTETRVLEALIKLERQDEQRTEMAKQLGQVLAIQQTQAGILEEMREGVASWIRFRKLAWTVVATLGGLAGAVFGPVVGRWFMRQWGWEAGGSGH